LALSAGRVLLRAVATVFAKFNPEQIRVYLFEDFNLNPLEILQDIFSLWVSVKPLCQIYLKQNASVMPTNLKPALTTQVRQQLIEVYREDIWRLQKLIQRDLQTG